MPIKLPKCRLSAVGSKPQYTFNGVEEVHAERRFSLVIDSIRPLCSRTSTTFRRLVAVAAVGVEETEAERGIRAWRWREVRREKEEVVMVVKEKALDLEERERREKWRLKESRARVVVVIGAAAMAVIGGSPEESE